MPDVDPTPFNLNTWRNIAYANSVMKGFWPEHESEVNWAEKIALMHSELSELLEAHRSDPRLPCDKPLPLTREEEEVADLFLRLADYCGGRKIDLDQVVSIKHAYNVTRPHKHGKLF